MRLHGRCTILATIVLTCCLSPLAVAVTPASIFGDHMVLQREKPVPVWGTAEAGTEVTVEFASQKKSATADKDGQWKVVLDPMKASAEGRLLKVGDKQFKDVLVGEVWLGSGQSNMDSPIGWQYYKGLHEKARSLANKSTIRYYGMPGYEYFNLKNPFVYDGKPVPPPADKTWTVLDPDTSLYCSAVLFFFAVRLEKELGVPVGILNRAVGATPCAYWLPQGALSGDPNVEADRKKYREHAQIDAGLLPYKRYWRRNYPPSVPESATAGPEPTRAGGGYSACIEPLLTFAVRGMCWDQGEYGPGAAVEPETALAALIRSWRKAWQQEAKDWPVLVVQKPQGYGLMGQIQLPPPLPKLPRYDTGPFNPAGSWEPYRGDGWSYWEVCKREPNVHIVNSMDLDDNGHPADKDRYGDRMADVALARIYGRPAASASPCFAAAEVKGDRVLVRFDRVGEGLKILAGTDVRGFRLAGTDRIFYDAEATITGKDTVTLFSVQVPQPAVVLYGVAVRREESRLMRQTTVGLGTLASSDGLQAFPFRSAAWAPPTKEGLQRATRQLLALLDDTSYRYEAARNLAAMAYGSDAAVAKLDAAVRTQGPDAQMLIGVLAEFALRDPAGAIATQARQVLVKLGTDKALHVDQRGRAIAWLSGCGAEAMDVVPALRAYLPLAEPDLAKQIERTIDSVEKAAAKKKP